MAAIIHETNDILWRYAVETGYDAAYVEELKLCIPARQRKWDSDSKLWLFRAEAIEMVMHLLRRHFNGYEWADRAAASPKPSLAESYAALHLLPSAPVELVRVAYKHLAKVHHPDHGGDTATMQRVNAAFDLIAHR